MDAFLRDKGKRIDFERSRSDPQFWRDLVERAVAQEVPEVWKFETLIVDEGQDFEPDWLEVLRCFLRPAADMVWLEDSDQNIFGRKPIRLEGAVGYRARTIYRSPESIARFIRDTLPFEFEPANALPGRGVHLRRYTDPGDQPAEVGRIVDELMKQGFAYEDIVVLSCQGLQRSAFHGRGRAGRHVLKQFTDGYDIFGNQLMSDGRLLFDSVYRFKGQQAPAVILVDVDPKPDRLERERRLLFCGMTRATVRLDMLVKAGNPVNDRYVER